MATKPQSNLNERPGPTLVEPGRGGKRRPPNTMRKRVISTVLALLVLGLMLRYLPQESRSAEAKTKAIPVEVSAGELHLSGLQMSRAMDGEAIYVDGMATNASHATITAATAEVDFLDAHGQVVGTVQKPLSGMAHGGTDLIKNAFGKNPLPPNEMRFFRVAVEQAPAGWNRETPMVKIVAVKAQ